MTPEAAPKVGDTSPQLEKQVIEGPLLPTEQEDTSDMVVTSLDTHTSSISLANTHQPQELFPLSVDPILCNSGLDILQSLDDTKIEISQEFSRRSSTASPTAASSASSTKSLSEAPPSPTTPFQKRGRFLVWHASS
jgi:hypothetical protein